MAGIRGPLHAVYDLWASDTCRLVTSVVGTLFIAYVAFQVALTLWRFIQPSNLEVYCHSESGSWALVTGASDGIGRAFSSELLKRGFNVLLHGRNPEKLARVKKELAESYPKRTIEIVVADASTFENTYANVVDKVKKLSGKLTILVNNVGGVMTKPQYISLSEIPHNDIDSQVNTNLRFPTHLTRELLPMLRENGPSLILNCGSSGGLMGVPYIVTYSATKAYIHEFTQSLKTELVADRIDNIEVLGFLIGNVTSAGNTHPLAWTVSSEECAAGCLNKVGKGRSPLVFSHWKHAVQVWPLRFIPDRNVQDMLAAEMKKRREVERKQM